MGYAISLQTIVVTFVVLAPNPNLGVVVFLIDFFVTFFATGLETAAVFLVTFFVIVLFAIFFTVCVVS